MTGSLPASSSTSAASNRREFMQTSAAVVAGGAFAASLAAPAPVHAAGGDTLKIGLIGCGGRGLGAAVDAMEAEDNVKLTVLADVFKDQIDHARNVLGKHGPKFAVDNEHCFHGFDAYKQVMASDIDVVLLCTPTHFRPLHLRAAVEAGKHIFCEKPVAVDGPGLRSVLESSRMAKEKKLSLVSGLCWRYDLGVRDTVKRIQDGMIGDVLSIQENYLTGTLWHRGREPKWSEMEYQIRNWLYFTWLSGDHIVEQHIHSLDKAVWLYGDKAPTKCFGLGGRQVRTDAQWGNVYDHFAVCFEWEDGRKCHSYTRQMADCGNDVDDYIIGSKGRAVLLKHQIQPESGDAWRYRGPKPSMYRVEHKELFASIRSGNLINNGEYMTYSTLMAIMGREACYTGQTITADQVMKSNVKLGPDKYEWADVPAPAIAIPGRTTFA